MRVDAAYAACEDITRHEARNFAYGIRLLPRERRQAMSAVYATARRIDDIGDGNLPPAEKTALLQAARTSLHHLGDAAPSDAEDPVLVALSDASRHLPIPLDAFDDLIDGCEADVAGRNYATIDEVVGYCRCVAGSIGRLSLGIYDPPDRAHALPLADALGVALQLTNILRDLREDRLVGRVYLPARDLRQFGCGLEVDDSGDLDDPPDAFAALVRFEAARAEEWYARGLSLLPLLDWRSAACTAAMAGIYHRLLAHIATHPEQVRSRRLSLSGTTKAAVAARALTRRTA
jgi:15-cis-phytoene synthase